MGNWASLDEQDAAGQACQEIAREKITPHGTGSRSSFIRFMPEQSKSPDEIANVIWVSSFRTRDGRKFRAVVDAVTESMRKVEGEPRGYWYNVLGGSPKSADLIVVIPYENFAALDIDRDGVWAVLEKDRGEDEAERLRADARDSTESSWGYLYRRNAELTNATISIATFSLSLGVRGKASARQV